ncbi:alpha/beta hydrolase [Cupriavidus gilardii]|uniref:alpha/beta fold hydrolase n=1 Tax=Cupriavidus gilardii TaxID=82541 RepID=UPI001ABDD318|nr:alpha/beta hydrolase [Cupriavidus gilardii]MBO4123612.1 alpha/beta hydrolase [Cupriavidus gilardii]
MDVIEVGSGPVPVVALHGIQGTRAAWLPVAARLRSLCTFVLPNLQGRGAAPRPDTAEGYTLERYAAAARAVVERHVGARPFVLAGWSMGVSVALEYADRYRYELRPAALLLLSGSPALCETRWFRAGDDPALLAEITERERRLGLSEAADHAAVAHTWRAIRHTDQRSRLPSLPMPALVVHGRDDDDCPWPHAQALADGLPAGRLATIERAGHGLLTGHADTVAELALPWLRQLADAMHGAAAPLPPSSIPLELP